jgi:hypothetical protein
MYVCYELLCGIFFGASTSLACVAAGPIFSWQVWGWLAVLVLETLKGGLVVSVDMSEAGISFRAKVTNISLVDTPFGEKLIRLELTEEREVPGPVVVQRDDSEIAREIAPIISQVMRMMPGLSGNVMRVPRVTVVLTEDEWESFAEKPSIGDFFTVEVSGKIIRLKKE